MIYVALKAVAIGARRYAPGDTVDVGELPAYKLGQLLEHRYLAPAAP